MQLQYGLLGGGNGAFIGDVHRRGIAFTGLAGLCAGCFSRNMEQNLQTAKLWNIADESRVYADYRSMAETEALREDGIDFVVIATPNYLHYEMAKAFLEKGIHVCCDKPLALTVEEATELEQLAKEKKLCFGVTYSYGGYAMIRQARTMVETGEIGQIVHVAIEYPQDWLLLGLAEGKKMWRLDTSLGAISLATADIGTHLEYLITAATGLEVTEVLARFDYIPAEMQLETNSNILLKLSNGASGALWSSVVAIGHDSDVRIRIYGSKGSLEWFHGTPGLLKVCRFKEPAAYYAMNRPYNSEKSLEISHLPAGHPEGYFEAFANIYEGFCRDIIAHNNGLATGGLYYPTVSDGVRGVRFIHACVKSNANGNTWTAL